MSSWTTWLIYLVENRINIHSSSDSRENFLGIIFFFGISFSFGISIPFGICISFGVGLAFGIRFFFVLSSISIRLLITSAPGYVWEHWIIIILIISSWISFDRANVSSSHRPDHFIQRRFI